MQARTRNTGRRSSHAAPPAAGRWAALPAVLLALSAGCGPAGGAAETVLRSANWSGPGNDPRFLGLERELIQEFEGRRPGVRVQVEQIPGPGLYEAKLLLMMLSGEPPDVLQLDASSAAVLVDNGLLLDLAPYMAADPDFRPDDYFDNVMEIARRGDRLFAVPLDFTPMVIVYNKRLFDAAGVPYPGDEWTWDDFLRAARALTIEAADGRPKQYGFQFENWMPLWMPWIWSNGGEIVVPDRRTVEGYFDGPRSLEAIRFLADLMLVHRAAPTPRESAAAGTDLFRAGRAAMIMTGHWMLIEYKVDGLDIGVAPIPTNTGRPVTVMYASSLAVAAGARQPRLAWEYVKFMTSEDVQRRRVSTGLAISGNRRTAEHYAARDALETDFLRYAANARPPIGARVERYVACEDFGREMFEDILNAGVPVEEAVHQAARLMQRALARGATDAARAGAPE